MEKKEKKWITRPPAKHIGDTAVMPKRFWTCSARFGALSKKNKIRFKKRKRKICIDFLQTIQKSASILQNITSSDTKGKKMIADLTLVGCGQETMAKQKTNIKKKENESKVKKRQKEDSGIKWSRHRQSHRCWFYASRKNFSWTTCFKWVSFNRWHKCRHQLIDRKNWNPELISLHVCY